MEVELQIGAVHKLLPAHKTLRNKRTKSNGHKNCTAGQIQIQLRGRSGFLVERFYGLISPSLEKMPACLVAKQKVQTNENQTLGDENQRERPPCHLANFARR